MCGDVESQEFEEIDGQLFVCLSERETFSQAVQYEPHFCVAATDLPAHYLMHQ